MLKKVAWRSQNWRSVRSVSGGVHAFQWRGKFCRLIILIQKAKGSLQTILFSCIPIRASWDRAGEPNAKCFSNAVFTDIGLFNSIVNILTDVLFASLPVTVVWNLQVNTRTKLSLLAILSLGYLFAVPTKSMKRANSYAVLARPPSWKLSSRLTSSLIRTWHSRIVISCGTA